VSASFMAVAWTLHVVAIVWLLVKLFEPHWSWWFLIALVNAMFAADNWASSDAWCLFNAAAVGASLAFGVIEAAKVLRSRS
jgi:hypothetical protein